MTRVAYDGCVDVRADEVRRVLERYLVEIVEAYNLCPWAASARRGGELAVDVLFGAPDAAAFAASARVLLARPETRVVMIVAPELDVTSQQLRALRDAVTAMVATVGIADFHPAAALDLATPARAVPFCRRSPDPLLQLVPLTILDAIRGGAAGIDRAKQLAMLGGYSTAPRAEVTEHIATANHATLLASSAAISATLDAIAADRAEAYARVGITAACR